MSDHQTVYLRRDCCKNTDDQGLPLLPQIPEVCRQLNWAVIFSHIFASFLEDRGHCCYLPVSPGCSHSVKLLLKSFVKGAACCLANSHNRHGRILSGLHDFLTFNFISLFNTTSGVTTASCFSAVCSDSDLIFRRTLLGYYAEGMHANFK